MAKFFFEELKFKFSVFYDKLPPGYPILILTLYNIYFSLFYSLFFIFLLNSDIKDMNKTHLYEVFICNAYAVHVHIYTDCNGRNTEIITMKVKWDLFVGKLFLQNYLLSWNMS